MGLFSLEKKILMDNLIFVLYYLLDRLEGGEEESGSSEVHSKVVGGSSCKLLYKRSWLNNRKIFLMVRVVKHWSRFLGEAVESPALKTKLNWKGREQPDLM